MLGEVADIKIRFAIRREGDQKAKGRQLLEPIVNILPGNIVILGKYPCLEPPRVFLHHSVIVRMHQ